MKLSVKTAVIYMSIAAFCISFLLTGCVRQYADLESAISDNARLKKFITIDGNDVGGMSVQDALALIDATNAERLKEIEYTLTLESDEVSVNASTLGIAFNTREVLMEALMLPVSFSKDEPRELNTEASADPKIIADAIYDACTALNKEAADAVARYDMDEGCFTYAPSENGRRVNVESTAEKLASVVPELIGSTIEADYTVIYPAVDTKTAMRDTAVISEFTTSFRGSTYSKKSRVFNIEKAASLINGHTLDTGEEFRMNAVLGDRNGENGWEKAAGIRDGTYVQEYGGGVCQVSTTLYNAVLMADLEVTDRSHHSWPLGYIDIGRDATISTGGPDFRFINDTQAPITVSAFTDTKKKTVTVRIFGRARADGLQIELRSEKTGHIKNPGTEVMLDESLPYGTERVEREARAGSYAKTYKLYFDDGGNEVNTVLVSEDKYRAIKGLKYVSADIYYGVSQTNGE